MLFLTGYTLGRQSGRPWVVGLSMVALGLSLVMSKVHIVKCDHNGDQFFNRTEMACVGGISIRCMSRTDHAFLSLRNHSLHLRARRSLSTKEALTNDTPTSGPSAQLVAKSLPEP